VRIAVVKKTRHYELEEVVARILKAAVGWDMQPKDVLQIGERIINIERAFVVRERVRRKDDTLPERFLKNLYRLNVDLPLVLW